ncbi:MAG: RHS repeat-associated core domain-containing protein [Candidatus Zixiibacteriota bacterium]
MSYSDHLGTPLAVTDGAKDIVWSSDYYPFGSLYDEQVVQSNELRFPGQYHDRESDLYYNWHRYYEPELGRYITPDPLGLGAGDVNLYRYVWNSPHSFVDPWGLKIDWGHYRVNNMYVRYNLERLNQAIIDQGYDNESFTIRVTGGDRYSDENGLHFSASGEGLVRNSDELSPHLIERGARAVDFQLEGFGSGHYNSCMMSVFEKALKDTEFLPENNRPLKKNGTWTRKYGDGHIHVALPYTPQFMWHPPMTWEVTPSE